jgi:predicted MPP superfamily phosphohydrolase
MSWLSRLARWVCPLEFGAFGPLGVRREEVRLGLSRPVSLLYASDLHLGHWWTGGVPGQLIDVCRRLRPEVILLGGDLADRPGGLPLLWECVRGLAELAPVAAVPGNHDERPGVWAVRAAFREAGGHWLPDAPLAGPLPIDAGFHPLASTGPRLLCAHYPDVFPEAVRAGYRLVLAGHLHGGQCVLATVGGRLYPAAWVHRWHGLRFTQGDATLLVSRGAADTFPFRFNCPREVLLCSIV